MLRTRWELDGNTLRTKKIQHSPTLPKEDKNAGPIGACWSPHWMPRISMLSSVVSHFCTRLMAGHKLWCGWSFEFLITEHDKQIKNKRPTYLKVKVGYLFELFTNEEIAKQNMLHIRVILKVRPSGGENGQFRHNRASNT